MTTQANKAEPAPSKAEPAPNKAEADPAREASAHAAAGTRVDAALLREVVNRQPFTRWTGLEIVKAENGEVETRLALRVEDMTQHHGFLHGGLVGFLADNAAAYAAATLVGDVVTSQFSLNFLAPGVGEAFRAKASVIKAGKRQVVARVDVIAEQDGHDKLIAVAQATITPLG
ncbi:MAG: PaaI family thioesterase [Oceanicaulis sp.]